MRIHEDLKGKKILIVEDEEPVRLICAKILVSSGFDSILVGNGEEGLDAYREHLSGIILVLTDVSMPVKGGLEMMGEIMELKPDVKAILMSGYCLDVVIPRHFQARFSLLQKPFTAAALVEAVTKCVTQDRAQLAWLGSA